jgi:hypothetical protein
MFGKPLQPFQRLRRETYNYQPQSHLEHIANLKQYLEIAPSLIPRSNPALHRPVLRHPDLQPNIFVSDGLEITGLIDRQYATFLRLFLQCSIPDSPQNYGDVVSESLQEPSLPSNFSELSLEEQEQRAELFRKRQLRYLYVRLTSERNPEHYDALAYDFSTLRRRLFHYASDPWEGDNVTLRSNVISLFRKWADINGGTTPPCPLAYSDAESNECLSLTRAQAEANEQFKVCQDLIGVGSEGWMPADQYEAAMERNRALKDVLDAAETAEERARIEENWISDKFCED